MPEGVKSTFLPRVATTLVAMEVKASTSVSGRDFRHIDWFSDKGPGTTRTVTSIVFYLGSGKAQIRRAPVRAAGELFVGQLTG